MVAKTTFQLGKNRMVIRMPEDGGLVDVYVANWKDPPLFSWVNQRTKWAIFNSEL